MNKTFLFVMIFGVLLVGVFSVVDFNSVEDKFSCDNLGIIYGKQSELNDLDGFKESGAIIMIPETGSYYARTEVLECPTIDNYLGHLKQ